MVSEAYRYHLQPPNLGRKSGKILSDIGIKMVEQLRSLGSVAVYVKAKQSGAYVSLNLLLALEAAVTGLQSQTVSRDRRTDLLMALDDYERITKRD